ncbi:hypothetical protein CHRY9390_00150 [Chryseobacterium aquaeductus]|uniref:T9SS C-terminal target domain-containing protein n=1 Tax=Chryseobacterium aquaeductus TaxID=2675056 RepID=A0A9N8MF86_9FLAO|nr:hypothetical protein [Chryseobacterium aquaeductus]CAA7329511.1 hypothetical protein CHRY9390_00150 [Chryseobacterium potabilaquae]CAD7797326.1 hypothetical protein CHRY9390_00150 [Chryseobacterium aquaeductus]
MKQYILFLLFLGNFTNAQVAIGKNSLGSASSILEFGGETASDSNTDAETANFRGIILPGVTTSPVFPVVNPSTNNPQNGTFLYDTQLMKVRMFENGNWIDMTDTGTNAGLVSTVGTETGSGVIIGSNTSAAQGVFILESSNTALNLPHIKDPANKVKSPYQGMMCYDTLGNCIAVFDGVNWSYWK